MKNDKNPFSWKFIKPHLIIVVILSTIFVIIINTFGKPSCMDYFSGIGTGVIMGS